MKSFRRLDEKERSKAAAAEEIKKNGGIYCVTLLLWGFRNPADWADCELVQKLYTHKWVGRRNLVHRRVVVGCAKILPLIPSTRTSGG